ncbi:MULTISPECIES: ABC transporter permease [Lactiplantibacillus]|uniref:ABC transporter permease subunit n=1 Tax=Lactiplantibacillus pentosus TaxID=1589 RepID=A0AAW8WET4_LACPE|nr:MULTISPECIES: ABC transporter permease subunit [Lactiplantibacillus]MBU7477197.1 iron ABC transporter permease [Lactiplantibacillus pentosus]MBU7482538.1 iron ABC transporter permease [Lactiplantibacillus sp. 30.2.29]MBU7485730.1 iron ABC transporter permease [Lactiplantibacillus pentosus]MBU7498628.1 iron ABC transporter permease [Lactiplantibacillus pentosus]MBU7505133.1 iron ABC transporter permease [Lactiplantibacillus pentosus]
MNRRQGLIGLSVGGSLILAAIIIGPLIGLVGQTLLGQAPAALWHQLIQSQNQTSLQHSLFLGVGTMVLTTLIAIPLALIMTRTPLAQYRWLQGLLLVPFMTPPYINAMGWIYFFQPHGLLAQLSPTWHQHFQWLFSPAGMVLIMSLHLYPIAYLGLQTAFSQYNRRWTEAATVHGVSKWRQLTRISLPVMAVPYLAVWLLVFTKTLAEFGTPATFGRNIHFEVLTTTIQKDLSQWPLDFQNGVLTGTILLGLALTAWIVQQWLSRRPSVTLTGQEPIITTRRGLIGLASSYTALLVGVAIILPYSAILAQSLFKQRSLGWQLSNLTLAHYLELLRFDSPAFQAMLTTLGLALLISSLNVLIGLYLSLGSLTNRLPNWLRQVNQILGALPLAIPNVVLALSLMILFSQWLAFTKLYGTLAILVIADITLFLPTTVQYLTAALKTFDGSLLQSARVFEPNFARIIRKIALPILWPALANSLIMAFIATSRELVVALLLLPSGMTTVSTYIYQSFEQGEAASGMALAVITVVLTLLGTTAARRLKVDR